MREPPELDAQALRQKAQLCRRLARSISDSKVSLDLEAWACELERHAAEIEAAGHHTG
jgi:hypothetical protein